MCKVVGCQCSRLGAVCEFSDHLRELYHAEGVCASNDRYDQARRNVNGDSQIDVTILVYRTVNQRCIELGMGF